MKDRKKLQKPAKNENPNKVADENVVAGVLDGARLTDDVIAMVNGGAAEEQNTRNHSMCDDYAR